MRQTWTLWYLAGVMMVGALGCKHQPELKPPPTPEVCSVPSDKRFEQPARYPQSEMVTDPLKQKMFQDSAGPAKGGKPSSMAGGGGMSNY